MRRRESVIACVVVVSLVGAACFAADDLQAYQGEGGVWVLEDGRVVIDYSSPSTDSHGLTIDNASEHALISNGTTWTLLPPGSDPPVDTTIRIDLDGTGCGVVGHFAGELLISAINGVTGGWNISVLNNNETVVFQYAFQQTGTDGNNMGCQAQCPGGSCSCNGPGICWCFCGLLGEPHCIYIKIVIGNTHAS